MGKVAELLSHPLELKAALKLKFLRKPLFPDVVIEESADLTRCHELLKLTSRSFAAVIMELQS